MKRKSSSPRISPNKSQETRKNKIITALTSLTHDLNQQFYDLYPKLDSSSRLVGGTLGQIDDSVVIQDLDDDYQRFNSNQANLKFNSSKQTGLQQPRKIQLVENQNAKQIIDKQIQMSKHKQIDSYPTIQKGHNQSISKHRDRENTLAKEVILNINNNQINQYNQNYSQIESQIRSSAPKQRIIPIISSSNKKQVSFSPQNS